MQELHRSLCRDPRTLELATALVAHLHAFARETQLTHAEWARAVQFLTRAGQASTEYKNEFVLLSDCLGFSALVDEVNHPKPPVRCARFSRPLNVRPDGYTGLYGRLRAWPVLH